METIREKKPYIPTAKTIDIFNEQIQLLHVRSGKSIFLVEIHLGTTKMKLDCICFARCTIRRYQSISRHFSHNNLISFVVNYVKA